MKRWWEKQTIRFECQKGCIQCCAKPGWVYFDKEDAQKAAAFLNLRLSDFKARYRLVPFAPGRWEMEVTDNAPCPFLGVEGCDIHPVKPKQCRGFPFWSENLATRQSWNKIAEDCPGIGQGPVYSGPEIRRQMNEFGG